MDTIEAERTVMHDEGSQETRFLMEKELSEEFAFANVG